VVEVLHDRGEQAVPRWLLGSGFVVRASVIITAAHNLGANPSECGPYRTVVRTLDGAEHGASVLVRSDDLDLALLSVPDIKAGPVKLGRISPEQIEVVRDVIAVGFPNYKYSPERPVSRKRQPAQPFGFIPTGEGFTGGDLTLKLEAGEPASPAPGANTPWEGLSGSGVFVGEYLLAVVVEHHPSEGMGSLRLMPLSRVVDLPGPDGLLLRAILGLDDLQQLEVVRADGQEDNEDDPALSTIVKSLQEVIKLGELGLLNPAEVSTLKITAYKEAKGWK
jgi:hypothetical protein